MYFGASCTESPSPLGGGGDVTQLSPWQETPNTPIAHMSAPTAVRVVNRNGFPGVALIPQHTMEVGVGGQPAEGDVRRSLPHLWSPVAHSLHASRSFCHG